MVFFTNVLSSVPAEMDFLVNMKDRDGQAMWVGKRASWTVMYEFLVTDMKTARPFTIEMDAESFVTQMKIPPRPPPPPPPLSPKLPASSASPPKWSEASPL
jgi:hypothetical protein